MDRIFKIHCSQIGNIMSRAKKDGELSVTCKTFLKEWYANDQEEIFSKYIDKGNQVEVDLIDFMADVLGFGMAEKNQGAPIEDEYFIGTCDVEFPECIVDVKAAWSMKTLHDASQELNEDYEWQGHGYMHLYKKKKFILFHGLLDTPEDANFGREVIYSHLPKNERWCAYELTYDPQRIAAVENMVIKCREWLIEYDKLIKSRIGKIN